LLVGFDFEHFFQPATTYKINCYIKNYESRKNRPDILIIFLNLKTRFSISGSVCHLLALHFIWIQNLLQL